MPEVREFGGAAMGARIRYSRGDKKMVSAEKNFEWDVDNSGAFK